MTPDMQPGVIIVSNRLPVSVKRVDGKLEFSPSVGGLATGLSSYANNKRNKWIGWPGIASDDLSVSDKAQITKELKKHNCYPVFLSQNQIDKYYNGFANQVLWPAFHEMPFKTDPPEAQWRAFREVNKLFAQTTLELSSRGSNIWVHDYQIPLVPALIRRERPHDKIGFFLHIPFPKPDVFLELPHSSQLLNGLLGCDLIGFHTPDYVRNFLDCCERSDIGTVGPRKLILPNRVVRVTDFPMGIDYGKFARSARGAAVKAEVVRLRGKYGRKKIILTVDRLDPTKGLVERLQAYREFLRQNPSQRGKVVMVMLAVPSRTDIPEYQRLKARLESLVKKVNKEFGSLRWQPVDYMFKSLPFRQLSALYRAADVAFIAPVKDGMNLVAKEYLASQPSDRGVLILSETAGAAGELRDAILVDPRHPNTLVKGLTEALVKPSKQLGNQSRKMRRYIARSTVQDWAGSFMNALEADRPRGRQLDVTHWLTDDYEDTLLAAYASSRRRQILLDYDGVLTGFVVNPADAKPDHELTKLLKGLTSDPANHVTVISGRSKQDLTDWLGDIDGLGLVAEHGAFVRTAGSHQWISHLPKIGDWQGEALPVMWAYATAAPGAHTEVKATALVWHYRQASPYYAQKALVGLKRELAKIARKYGLTLQSGHKIVELRLKNVDKGSAALDLVEDDNDFILAIGDDTTDEAMFKALPDRAFTIKVGRGRSAAHHRLKNVAAVRTLLAQLSKTTL